MVFKLFPRQETSVFPIFYVGGPRIYHVLDWGDFLE